MSAQIPLWRMLARNVLKDVRRSGLFFANPAATGDEKIGLPKRTRLLSTRITSARVSKSLSPASTFPALTASVTP
jgi:hypothetical protein